MTRKEILDCLGFLGLVAIYLACWALVALVKGAW